jgi:hypothetical protein
LELAADVWFRLVLKRAYCKLYPNCW